MKNFVLLILFLITTYLIICFGFYFLQEKLIFHPTKLQQHYKFKFKNTTEVFLKTADNEVHHALHFKQNKQTKRKGVVLYFHGNAGVLNKSGFAAKNFTKHAYDVFMVDYRSYGKSTGKITEKNLYDDAVLVYNFLLDDYEQDEIIIYGKSLGSGIACWLANKFSCKMLVLETPFYSMSSLINDKSFFYKIFPIKQILNFKFNNGENIKNIKIPTYIFHGTNDKIIPYKNAKKLKSNAKNRTFITIENASHNNVPTYAIYKNKIKAILK